MELPHPTPGAAGGVMHPRCSRWSDAQGTGSPPPLDSSWDPPTWWLGVGTFSPPLCRGTRGAQASLAFSWLCPLPSDSPLSVVLCWPTPLCLPLPDSTPSPRLCAGQHTPSSRAAPRLLPAFPWGALSPGPVRVGLSVLMHGWISAGPGGLPLVGQLVFGRKTSTFQASRGTWGLGWSTGSPFLPSL